MLGKNDGTFVQATGILRYVLTVKKLVSLCVLAADALMLTLQIVPRDIVIDSSSWAGASCI